MCNLLSWRLILEEEKKADWFYRLPKETIDQFLKTNTPLFEIKHPKSHIQTFQLNGNQIISKTCIWGTQPTWCPDFLTNTKSEKLISSPFWSQFINNRILIPVHSFFEWQTQKTGKKHKYEITFKNSNTFFAGLWGVENGKHWITVLTGSANEKMKSIHNSGENKHRQPIVMPLQNQGFWLDPSVTNPKDITDLLYQFSPDETREEDLNKEETLFD
ncbi:SOS response-associated peptidase [Leptospira sp. 2 VSF19]|uniref:Abasic site processing protein n=1 Tax=Leptospira soteropolitanensis TaxID=2950025 RepID=A0AAW5VQF7_9LEPT|nr:SOS response-associated peptidase family protein [Leptospira soteropolitanensis]MCW7494346.1 SOS response-associated peptidase [Leptospira soteropolitanensis]MCW7501945.1 SOS response-associated peptidase [Leptospira soteropolitanensis]MCW7524192.1 SOS response-associated peptidase [Leptospira soteropolitanensis]MCW7528057.1 SOS response-associated peptidase [Leptospira soteropolitanensis]MCW7531911.1 SOS response-associated peptidase [Leptospira soteropolitanensis]